MVTVRHHPTLPSRRQVAIALAGMFAALTAHAEGIIDLSPYVSATQTYDSNVFRLSSRDEARLTLGSAAMSDMIRRIEAGIAADAEISRQHLRLDLSFNRDRFDRFDFLDNDGYASRLAWNWKIGNHFSGEISTSESRAMAGFTEIQDPVLNERTTKRKIYSANWTFHPRWRLHLQRDETEQENSLSLYRISDRADVGHEAAIHYTTAAGNQIAMTARDTESEYPFLNSAGNEKSQRDYAVSMIWNTGGKTRFNGRVARIERTSESFPGRRQTGSAGRVGVDWQPSAKTALSISAARDISPVDDLAGTDTQTDSLSIIPSWAPTSKLFFQARASYQKVAYQVGGGIATGREDTLKSAGLTASYLPHEKVSMQLSLQKESRDSSLANSGYDANSLVASVRLNF